MSKKIISRKINSFEKDFMTFNQKIRKLSPLVLCLTNFVTVTDCANGLLAIGASPVMSLDPSDAKELASIASAVVLNIGTLTSVTLEGMIAAGREAERRKIPIIFDPVGVGATPTREKAADLILRTLHPTVIRGNASEILKIAGVFTDETQKGVDSSANFGSEPILDSILSLSERLKTIVAVSGEEDFLCSGNDILKVSGGTSLLTKITGTGCLLSSLLAAYVAANPEDPLNATLMGHALMKNAGENAFKKLKNPLALGKFKTYLFDELSILTSKPS
ncbi:MAG: hydroxyethylthiazole kinase [Deltaproteobacteria bacterium]|jgi:hydroxyethylthiazole kinase|nr:hydroxyethylthiazole kinase [Deltaproteobacteria bacterium]